MAAKDFTANQIRVAKLILTGGIGVKNVGLSVYSGSLASNNTGGVSDANMYTNVGTDVTLFVSGTGASRDGAAGGSVLFGGDVVTSGSLFVSTGSNQGIVLESPNGTQFYLTVDNAGNLGTTAV